MKNQQSTTIFTYYLNLMITGFLLFLISFFIFRSTGILWMGFTIFIISPLIFIPFYLEKILNGYSKKTIIMVWSSILILCCGLLILFVSLLLDIQKHDYSLYRTMGIFYMIIPASLLLFIVTSISQSLLTVIKPNALEAN